MEGNSNYWAEILSVMRGCAEHRFDLSQVKVTLSHFGSISAFFVCSVSFESIERN
jgi:hypothetical protein